MKESELKGYGKFYKSANGMESGLGPDPMNAFNQLMDRPPDTMVPLSISHGVDFCHCYKPLDIDCREPIHWAYNNTIYDVASKIKPTLLLPHPWVLVNRNKSVPKGQGTLVIGPPPGPENDKALHSLLLKHDITDGVTVLVKPRGNFQPSLEFWRAHGINSTCNDIANSGSYSKLFDLLAGFDRVIGFTFSSVLVYAAYMGKKISLLEGYSHRTYDMPGYREKVDFGSQRARDVVRTFHGGSMDSIVETSRNLLGHHLPATAVHAQQQYASALEKVRFPIHFPSRQGSLMQRIAVHCARLSGRAGFLTLATDGLLPFLGSKKIGIMHINELDIWLNGLNNANFSFRIVDRVNGLTVPGFAVSQYS